jgi:hypothetical protein
MKANMQQKVNLLFSNEDVKYYMYDGSVLFNREKATELAKAKAWCIFLKDQFLTENFKTIGIQKKQDFLSICTDVLTNLKDYWKLADYLNVLKCIEDSACFYFTSNKSQIIELCDWM